MENRLKQRFSRMFRSSFGSCRTRNITDVIERPDLIPQNRQHYQLIELFSPKPRPFPSICRSKCSETFENVEKNCIIPKELFPRRKVSDKNSLLLVPAETGGRKCPPATPISPLFAFDEFDYFESKRPKAKKLAKSKKKKKKKPNLKKKSQLGFEINENYSKDWFFSIEEEEEEDDGTTLFSSKSLSSDTSDSFLRKHPGRRRKRAPAKDSEMGLMPLQGRVRDSFPVVKKSSDPYSDFRNSMVEMIIEKQIFTAKDLENLLQCFLSLNSYHHHRVILEVFTEIWETLFSNWS